MMDDLKKMMMKKADKAPEMDQAAIEAKLDVIKELMQMAQATMAGKVKGGLDEMHKVTVMAPDQEGLAEGLDKAEDVVDEAPEMESDEASPEVEGMSALMDKNDEPEEEENLFARKRSKQLKV